MGITYSTKLLSGAGPSDQGQSIDQASTVLVVVQAELGE
jgi:hypothetical protein